MTKVCRGGVYFYAKVKEVFFRLGISLDIANIICIVFSAISLAVSIGTIAYKIYKDRRKQANLLTVWVKDNKVIICNNSNLLIYDVVVTMVLPGKHQIESGNLGDAMEGVVIYGSGVCDFPISGKNISKDFRARFFHIPPGDFCFETPKCNGKSLNCYGVEVYYKDTNGNYWLRKGGGNLKKKCNETPEEYYGKDLLPLPSELHMYKG